MNRPERMNIAYIGREAIYQILVENHFTMFDFHYTQYVDTRFNVQREIEKIFKLKNITCLVVDYYVLNTDAEFTNALNNYKAINPDIHIIVTLFEKKYHNNDFEMLKVGNLNLEIENKEVEKGKSFLEKISEKKDEIKGNIEDKKSKKKILIDEKNVVENVVVESCDIESHEKINDSEKKESKSEKKDIKINIPKIPKLPKFNIKEKIRKNNMNILSKNIDFLDDCNVEYFSNDKVVALYSDFSLQGISTLSYNILNHYENTCVIDTNMSFIKLSGHESIETYLRETLIIADYFEFNKLNIYSVNPNVSSQELKTIIRKLLTKYSKVVIDLKSDELFKDLSNELTISSYYVIEEDFDIFHMARKSEIIKIPYIKLIINKSTNTFTNDDIKKTLNTDLDIIQIA